MRYTNPHLLYFILQVNYPILLQTGTGGPCRNYVGQEVKGQGHKLTSSVRLISVSS